MRRHHFPTALRTHLKKNSRHYQLGSQTRLNRSAICFRLNIAPWNFKNRQRFGWAELNGGRLDPCASSLCDRLVQGKPLNPGLPPEDTFLREDVEALVQRRESPTQAIPGYFDECTYLVENGERWLTVRGALRDLNGLCSREAVRGWITNGCRFLDGASCLPSKQVPRFRKKGRNATIVPEKTILLIKHKLQAILRKRPTRPVPLVDAQGTWLLETELTRELGIKGSSFVRHWSKKPSQLRDGFALRSRDDPCDFMHKNAPITVRRYLKEDAVTIQEGKESKDPRSGRPSHPSRQFSTRLRQAKRFLNETLPGLSTEIRAAAKKLGISKLALTEAMKELAVQGEQIGPKGLTRWLYLAGRKGNSPTRLRQAVELVKELLKDGPIPSDQVYEEGRKHGFGVCMLRRRAAPLLNITFKRAPVFQSPWHWCLPGQLPARPGSVSVSDKGSHSKREPQSLPSYEVAESTTSENSSPATVTENAASNPSLEELATRNCPRYPTKSLVEEYGPKVLQQEQELRSQQNEELVQMLKGVLLPDANSAMHPAREYAIITFGDRVYQVGHHRRAKLTENEDSVLQAFLEKPTMDKQELIDTAGFDSAPRVLQRLCKKHNSMFAPAITLPGTRGNGGYHVEIRRS